MPPTKLKTVATDIVALIVELPGAEAVALARFLKRLSPEAIGRYASNEIACRDIGAAMNKLQNALADAYKSPVRRSRRNR